MLVSIKKGYIVLMFLLFMIPATAIFLPVTPQRKDNEQFYAFTIIQNSDDGTEVNESIWFSDGLRPSINYIGCALNDETYYTGLRFHLEGISQGEEIVYARLKIPARGSNITSTSRLLIEGVLQSSTTPFSQDERPSQKNPKTDTKIEWNIEEPWLDLEGTDKRPLYYSSPNIAPIINEILALPNWGGSYTGKAIIITIKDNGSNSNEINRVFFEDFWKQPGELPGELTTPAILEVYRTVYSTFLGKELLGRIGDTSITVNLYSLIETDVYIEYGTTSGVYTHVTPGYLNQSAETPIEIVLDNLYPDTQYYYRLAYRKAGENDYQFGEEHSFHTQRPKNASFNFVIIADEHFIPEFPIDAKKFNLYKQTLKNIENDAPDFLISLGDAVVIGSPRKRSAANQQEAIDWYLFLREYLNGVAPSTPFYLVIGNHEGEQGWYYDFNNPGQNNESLAVIGTKARKALIPNPYPNNFYLGNPEIIPEYGLREDYYAWEWGDALFVVLDPFWYTKNRPMDRSVRNNWEWTLGKEQYDWLYETLHSSTAKWKFVFIHHLTSSCTSTGPRYYGRGGIEIAKFKVDNLPSFEWGGENEIGEYVFDEERPNWTHGPIHDILVAEGVTIVFHGHDHFFAKQMLDEIIYQEVPTPDDPEYSYGHKDKGGYKYGVFYNNSGHIRVTVDPERVKVAYVRSYLEGDGENGIIEYEYTINKLSIINRPDALKNSNYTEQDI